MRTIKVNLYQYDELDDEAKRNALEWTSDININYDWWDNVYEDAETIGLKIMGFDLGQNNYLDGGLVVDIGECASRIIANHGKDRGTYQLAMAYYKRKRSTPFTQEEFQSELKEEYLSFLQKEYEYLTSKEAIAETIRANEYEFTVDGKRDNTAQVCEI